MILISSTKSIELEIMEHLNRGTLLYCRFDNTPKGRIEIIANNLQSFIHLPIERWFDYKYYKREKDNYAVALSPKKLILIRGKFPLRSYNCPIIEYSSIAYFSRGSRDLSIKPNYQSIDMITQEQ